MFSWVNRFGLAAVCLSASGAWGQYIISTVAGEGPPASPGYSGDGGTPTAAQLYLPTGMAYSKGKLYIADSSNHCIRVISSGAISTFAGVCGTAGYFGDGGAATLADLDNPTAVALDPNGDVLIADTSNNVVRIVVPSGIISTFAGNHTPGYTGDNGPATAGSLNAPTAIASDTAGNIYVTDTVNGLVRKINAVQTCVTTNNVQTCGNYLSTPIGIGSTGGSLNHPNGLAVDANFTIYVSDTSHRVLKFANGALTTYAGNGNVGFSGDGGLATAAVLNDPIGLALDAAGNLYITDANSFRVRVVAPNGIINTIAGSSHAGYTGDGGSALAAQLDFPHMAIPDGLGNIYIADTGNNVIRMLTTAGPGITTNGVVSSASFQPAISPGALASIAGTNLATSTATDSVLPLLTNFGEATVTVNGKAAPILYVSSSQINFQVPWETQTGNATVTVTVNGTVSNTITVPVTSAAPGIFFNSSGSAIAQNHDYSLNTASNPAHVGSYLIAYLTGSGPVTPAIADGAATPATGLVQPTSAVKVTIGGSPATVLGAALTPGFVSLLQLNISVPSGLAAGTYPMVVTIAGQVSNSATVSIAP